MEENDMPIDILKSMPIDEICSIKKPSLAVDAIVMKEDKYLLIKRKNPPYGWALPGGFVDYGETVENALMRELREETSLNADSIKLFEVASDPKRDSRFHTVSLIYEVPIWHGEAQAADDAKELGWFTIKEIDKMDIAFDHKDILVNRYLKSWLRLCGDLND